jgi:N-acyl-L-homoserine lactone synthetase
MTTVEIGTSSQLLTKTMTLMHEFRHEVFVKRLGWSLPSVNGTERDQYDGPDAKYVVLSDASGRITACARLLPTTGSYMTPELFPQLLGSCAPPNEPGTWELSRFATSVRETREGRVLSLSKSTLDFLELVFDCARQNNISRLILVTSIGIERLMLRAGLPVHRVGPPAVVDGHLAVALFIEVGQKAAAASTGRVVPKQEAAACALRIPAGVPLSAAVHHPELSCTELAVAAT